MPVSVSGRRRNTLPSWSGSRTPTTQGFPNRSPMMRVSPPALTMARVKPWLLQDLDAAIHGIALGDATQVDAHAGRWKWTVSFFGSSTMCRKLMPGRASAIAFWSGCTCARKSYMYPTLAYVMSKAPCVSSEYFTDSSSRRNSSSLIFTGCLAALRLTSEISVSFLPRAHEAIDALHVVKYRLYAGLAFAHRRSTVRPRSACP
jgi:hypothetical protein